jgi:hypothetical protein
MVHNTIQHKHQLITMMIQSPMSAKQQMTQNMESAYNLFLILVSPYKTMDVTVIT